MSPIELEILSYFNLSEYIPAPAGMMTLWYRYCLKLKAVGLLEMISEQYEDNAPLFICKTTSKGKKLINS
jgi:hypothetical protein